MQSNFCKSKKKTLLSPTPHEHWFNKHSSQPPLPCHLRAPRAYSHFPPGEVLQLPAGGRSNLKHWKLLLQDAIYGDHRRVLVATNILKGQPSELPQLSAKPPAEVPVEEENQTARDYSREATRYANILAKYQASEKARNEVANNATTCTYLFTSISKDFYRSMLAARPDAKTAIDEKDPLKLLQAIEAHATMATSGGSVLSRMDYYISQVAKVTSSNLTHDVPAKSEEIVRVGTEILEIVKSLDTPEKTNQFLAYLHLRIFLAPVFVVREPPFLGSLNHIWSVWISIFPCS